MILSISFLTLSVIFMVGWAVSLKIRNASIVDAMWALTLPLPVAYYLLTTESSFTARNLILIAMAILWALRLGIHLAKRIYKHHPTEDPRYKSLREHWGDNANRNFIGIFLLNSSLVFLLSLPFYVASQNSNNTIETLESIGIIVYLIGITGEIISDKQLSDFLRNTPPGNVCQQGIWNYSRHPNYFFEAVIWIGIYIFCTASPGGIYTIHAPIIMILLLTKVSGIPPAEKSSLRSKGDAYRDYQKTTSAFVPWFKKHH